MEKRKILIVSRAFHPLIAPRAFRATELAKEFARQGHNVTVITHKRDFDYDSYSKQHNFEIKDFAKGKWKDIPQTNIVFKIFRKILNYLFLFPDIQLTKMVKNALKNENDYDLLISIAVPYPVHWGVARAIKKNKNLTKTWVADCGDPFMGSKETILKMPFYFKYVENWFCNKPNFLTVPIPEAIEAYPEKCRNKIRVIPQGFNFEENTFNNEITKNTIPTFAYAGGLSKGVRDPHQFLEFLSKINIDFRFYIFTKNQNLITPFSKRLANKLIISDYIPREQLMEKFKKVDFLLNIENLNSIQSPSKLIDYALSKKPILSISPNKLDEKKVNKFLNGDYSDNFVIKDIEQYNISNVARNFIKLNE